MENLNIPKHKIFYSIGLSYKKADAEVRGKFSLDAKAKIAILEDIERKAKAKDPSAKSLRIKLGILNTT